MNLALVVETSWPQDLSRLRMMGWAVAVHNDYRQNGEKFTFWLFTHDDGRYVKGEGRTDGEAIYVALKATRIDDAVTPNRCRDCGMSTVPYKAGGGCVCPKCHICFERGKWWTVVCDDGHQHDLVCMYQARPRTKEG